MKGMIQMKLLNELPVVVEALRKIQHEIPLYAEQLKASSNYNDFETRLAWDCMRAVMGTEWICSMYAKYNCNDTHLTTLAKRALKEVYKMQ